MSGVKKAGKAKGGTARGGTAKGRTAKGGTAKGRTAKGGTAKGGTAKAGRPRAAATTRTIVRIRDLDPYRKCGPGTSVERLIRVDEMVDRTVHAHLVFLDRHGWYCEHGRGCPAVGHARKHAAHVERPVCDGTARMSPNARIHDTHGRMRR